MKNGDASTIPIANCLAEDSGLTRSIREYLRSLTVGGNLAKALRGEEAPDREAISSIDFLLNQSKRYGSSQAFQEMIDFVGRFRDYAPYNNMLVRLQNPSCSFYGTAKDWRTRFNREIKEDARPMLILAPMHPVMLVYELDQTEGDELPQEIREFAHFEGEWDSRFLERLVKNAEGHRILVQFKTLSSTNGGFATLARETGDWKMRVAVHDQLDEPSRCGVLCHELAHILLGHLGSDWDHWWPARTNLSHAAVEVEAEAVAWIVTTRFGLTGASVAYVSRHLKEGQTPTGVSPDMIAKTAGHIECMSKESMSPRRPRARKEKK
ncbi:MAG: ImmA/IrrE family metallo-endopeptidase [Pirellulaceae bacterium]